MLQSSSTASAAASSSQIGESRRMDQLQCGAFPLHCCLTTTSQPAFLQPAGASIAAAASEAAAAGSAAAAAASAASAQAVGPHTQAAAAALAAAAAQGTSVGRACSPSSVHRVCLACPIFASTWLRLPQPCLALLMQVASPARPQQQRPQAPLLPAPSRAGPPLPQVRQLTCLHTALLAGAMLVCQAAAAMPALHQARMASSKGTITCNMPALQALGKIPS